MVSSVLSATMSGMNCHLLQVEVSVTDGLPTFEMVGYLSNQVKEAKERVKVALHHSGISLPAKHITVNISPADIRKDGNAFDLPIAIAILVALNVLPKEKTENILLLGELGLGGEIKAVKGVLPIVLSAKEEGIRKYLLPKGNAKEGVIAKGVSIYSADCLKDAVRILLTEEKEQEKKKEKSRHSVTVKNSKLEEDFCEINGQVAVKRAAEIAAAGFHNLLLSGPPGAGKTMIAKRMPSILPSLTRTESLELSKIYSIAGLLLQDKPQIQKRPFLNPHHTISARALAGGGKIPKPGIITLAHHGVLFLDELPEFKRETLEILRQPMEERKIHIARNYGNFTYPAHFMLVASKNPCPCGYYPNVNRCNCSEYERKRYENKVSGPLLDRIDILVEVMPLTLLDLKSVTKNESSEKIRLRVEKARKIQANRYQNELYSFNSAILGKDIKKYCALGKEEEIVMEKIFVTMKLSARGYYRMLRVARTIADLEGFEKIQIAHLAEAACYRSNNTRQGGEDEI